MHLYIYKSAYCYFVESLQAAWTDCDNNYATCGSSICGSASGFKSGSATGFVEYSDQNTIECCGDYRGENYRYCQANSW